LEAAAAAASSSGLVWMTHTPAVEPTRNTSLARVYDMHADFVPCSAVQECHAVPCRNTRLARVYDMHVDFVPLVEKIRA
jgi:hypothetical protein